MDNEEQEQTSEEVNEAPEQEQEESNEEPKNEVEEKAKSTGHLSKEEWVARGGKPEAYKSEKEYVLTGELIDLKKAVQKRDKEIEEILTYHQNIVETQKKNYKQRLEQEMYQAKQIGDTDKVEELTKQKINVDQQDQAQKQAKIQNEVKLAVSTFVERNKHWYNPDHPDLVQKAQELEQDIISGAYQARTGIPYPANYDGVVKQIELAMKYENPEAVSTSGVSRPTLSATKSSINSVAASHDVSNDGMRTKLNSNQKAVYDSLSRSLKKKGINYSVKEFIEKTKSDGEV